MSNFLGNSITFTDSVEPVLVLIFTRHYYNYNEDWQLLINTLTKIDTFLMVFLLQNTQNHETVAIHLKLDEIIRAIKVANNEPFERRRVA